MEQFDEYDDDFEDLEKDDYIDHNLTEKIIEIINISKDIAKIYKGIIYDNDNKTLLKELNILKKIENQLYQKLELNMSKLVTIKSMLREYGNVYGLSIDNTFGAVCNYDIENLWEYRIEDKIEKISKGKLDNIIKLINSSDKYIQKDELEDIQRTKIEEALSDDFIHAYMFFLDEEINKCEEGRLKQYLIETKYKLIYATSKLDDEFIENLNNKDNSLYISFSVISDLLLAPKELVNYVQEDSALSYLDYAVGNIELLNQYGGEDELEKIFTIYFRAGLALMYNSENYELLMDDIKLDIIDDNGYDTFSCLDEYIREDNLDREKCKYLSIHRPNNY